MIFGKCEFEAGEAFGHPKSRIFFAGANFIASRRRGSYFKCLVEWLHRREIASAGAIVHTNELVQCINFRCSDGIFAIEKNASQDKFCDHSASILLNFIF